MGAGSPIRARPNEPAAHLFVTPAKAGVQAGLGAGLDTGLRRYGERVMARNAANKFLPGTGRGDHA